MPRKRRPIQAATAPGNQPYGARQETMAAQAAIPLPDTQAQQSAVLAMPAEPQRTPPPPASSTDGSGAGGSPSPAPPPPPPPTAEDQARAMPAVGGLFASPPSTPPTGTAPSATPDFWIQMAVATDDPYWLELAQQMRGQRFSHR